MGRSGRCQEPIPCADDSACPSGLFCGGEGRCLEPMLGNPINLDLQRQIDEERERVRQGLLRRSGS